jgi:hypothetical protein
MANVVLISCSNKKRLSGMKVQDLYISPLFIKSLNYAEKILKPARIYILSTKHGLLELDKIIEPYDETLNSKNRHEKVIWSQKVIKQLSKKCHLDTDNFIFLAGRNYYENLIEKMPNHVILMENLPIGQRLRWLNGELND